MHHKSVTVHIDPSAGFCNGVTCSVEQAEALLADNRELYCLGELVHNQEEVQRLHQKGLRVIDKQTFKNLKDTTVLLRSHGEPPQTYRIAEQNNLCLVDSTCKIVLGLQKRIKKTYDELLPQQGQVVIFGKPGHPEVVSLNGQINNKGIIISSIEDIKKIDFTKPVALFSQTTMEPGAFQEIVQFLKEKMEDHQLKINKTICHQVAGRKPKIQKFASEHDAIIFVAGRTSSNGRVLYEASQEVNSRTYFISHHEELNHVWLKGVHSIGISGATSTPLSQLNEVARIIKEQKF